MIEEYYNDVIPGSDVEVLFCGKENCLPLHKFEGLRNHFIVHYIISGEGKVLMNNKSYNLQPGSAFFIFPDQKNYYRASKNNPWVYKWVGFIGNRADDLLMSIGISRQRTVFNLEFSKEIESLFDNIFDNLKLRNQGFELSVKGLFFMLLSIFFSKFGKHTTNEILNYKNEDYIDKIISFIDNNFQRDISVIQMAEYLGINRSYFSTLFKKRMGSSVQEYLIQYRMNKAKEMLVHSNYTISEIAYSTGYTDYFSFIKSFKKNAGSTPKEYRKKNFKLELTKNSCSLS